MLKSRCVYDAVFDWTSAENRFMVQHRTFKDWSIAFTSLYLDGMIIFFSVHIILYAKNARILISVGVFYFSRAICQALFLFEFPIGYAFDDPGFPSLMVAYQVTSDFYYSGHCGILVFIAMELRHLGHKKLYYCNILVLMFMIFVMLSTRGHYSIDIVISILAGFYSQMVGFKLKAFFKR